MLFVFCILTMLARHCIKLTNSARKITSKKYYTLKYNIQNTFNKEVHIRNISITATKYYCSNKTAHKGIRNEILFSGGLEKDQIKTKQTGSSEQLLEKVFASISADIHQKNRVYKNDILRIVNKIKELNFSSKKQGLLLINCCTQLLVDETSGYRLELVEEIWDTIKSHTKFTVDHYNELLKVYIDNEKIFNVSRFIQLMAPVKPNIHTYELILRALGEVGDINQATEVISNMKTQGVAATEKVFNALIICQGKAGNIESIKEVLTMMKSLQLKYTAETYTLTARAYALNKKINALFDVMDKAVKNGIKFNETHIMEIVKTLADANNFEPVRKVLSYLPEDILKTPSISPYMQSVATLLVFKNQPTAALDIYKCLPLPSFGPKDDLGLHGRSLVRDCVKASLPSSVIALITQELMSSGRNPIAIQNATEAALQLGKTPLALDLFTRMKQLGLPLRPHYFWPILLRTSNTYGEKGIMNTLSTMLAMDVKPDYETIMEYTLPYVSFTSPQNLMKKFLEVGLNTTTVLTPMMVTLLNTGQVRSASEICELFQGKIDVELVLQPLIKGYLMSSDLKSTVHILEDMTSKALDKNRDWVGRFICEFLRHKKLHFDMTDLLAIVKALQPTELKVSTSVVDYCMAKLPEKYSKNEDARNNLKDALLQITDESLVDEGDFFVPQIPHQKQMNEESLKSHLNELEAKGMNTRGVLRKLLQQYCREGNLSAAKEIVDKCRSEDVFISAGMKASIFDLHVKLGDLEEAETVLADLNKTSPNFTLDEFKIIDFATLMVYRKKIDRAFKLITEQSKNRRVTGGRSISLNCWRLLDAVAANGTPQDVQAMFDLLTTTRYCQPSNSLLGPLVRVYLKSEDIEQAVQKFVQLATKYNKTPLKHELLCVLLRALGEGRSEETFVVNERANGRLSRLMQTVLNVDKKVHGAGGVQMSLIAALAEVGYKKTLRKLFLDPSVKFHPDSLMRYCERFAEEKKVNALETIAECSKDLRYVDVAGIYDLLLDVHQRDDNCQEAISLWYKMQGLDVTPSQQFVKNICALCKANNKQVPPDLSLLVDKQANKISTK